MARNRRAGAVRNAERAVSGRGSDPMLSVRRLPAPPTPPQRVRRERKSCLRDPQPTRPSIPGQFVGQRRHPARRSAKLCWTTLIITRKDHAVFWC